LPLPALVTKKLIVGVDDMEIRRTVTQEIAPVRLVQIIPIRLLDWSDISSPCEDIP